MPPLSAPQNQSSEIDKQEMPELETLYTDSASPTYVPTEIGGHHQINNTINSVYATVAHANGNTTNIITTKQSLHHLQIESLGSTPNQHLSSTNSINSTSQRTFYTTSSKKSTMGQFDSKQAVSETKLNALFDQYKDQNEDSILADGIERLCDDLQVNPDEFRVLVLAWKLNAEQMCRFTRVEFVHGCKNMRVDSLKSIQQRLPELVKEIESNTELFKDLYRFTFRFGLDVVTGQRILPADMAICLWRLVFYVREPPILQKWLHFLEKHPHVRGIPRDTWNMFLNFAEAVGDDLSSYDDTEAWPSLFDDFVEYENDQMNQNISKENNKECNGGDDETTETQRNNVIKMED